MTNDNTPPPEWTCMDCQFGGSGATLCRKADGSHSFEVLARAYLASGEDADVADVRHRAFDCVGEMVAAAPAAAVGFLVVACAQCRDIAELCVIAAGPLEDLLELHGPAVIAQLETLAKVDPRFRLMLSGTWGRDRTDPAVWARLVAAVTPGPVIDHDGRTPSAGTGAPIVTQAELTALFSAPARVISVAPDRLQ
jgi:hypothetical protein